MRVEGDVIKGALGFTLSPAPAGWVFYRTGSRCDRQNRGTAPTC
jgi:hypothetical protein